MFTKRETRALLLMPEYVWGGAETQFRYLLEYAKAHRWKIDVIIEHRFKQKDTLLKKQIETMKNIKFYEMEGGTGEGKLFFQIMHCVLKNSLHNKYNICMIYYMPDLGIVPYIRMLGIQVLYSERIDATGIINNRDLQRCLRYCRWILANSEYGQREIERLTGRKVEIIRNGKPVVPMFSIEKKSKIRRILVPARIAPDKNQMLLLQYLKKYPKFDGKIVFAGVIGHKSYKGKLQQFVRKNGLQEKVEFLGYVEDLQEEYGKADIVILPSFAEGTPNVVLEAFAYGRIAIVSDIGPMRNIVVDPKMRFGIKNPDEIHACIRYVEEMPEEKYRQILQKNRDYVVQNYSIERMAEGFAKFINY